MNLNFITNIFQETVGNIESDMNQEFNIETSYAGITIVKKDNTTKYAYIDCNIFPSTDTEIQITSAFLQNINLEQRNISFLKKNGYRNVPINGSIIIPNIILDVTSVDSPTGANNVTKIITMDTPLLSTIDSSGGTLTQSDTPRDFNIVFVDYRNRVIRFAMGGTTYYYLPGTLVHYFKPTASMGTFSMDQVAKVATDFNIKDPNIRSNFVERVVKYASPTFKIDPGTHTYTPHVRRWGPLNGNTERLTFVENKNVLNLGLNTTYSVCNAKHLIYNNDKMCSTTIYFFDNQSISIESKYGYFYVGHINTKNGTLETYNSTSDTLKRTRTECGTYICKKSVINGSASFNLISY